MQSESERLDEDEMYERDREAWNLPRPRPQLGIPSAPKAPSDDRSGYGSHARRESDRAA